ncbi:regulatory protein [Klebsiella quasipneumoniae]|uniref:hypothetical protein n=1 Tax=Klebsiella quasipneumoniae TaxID=1463165 RepID=UPI0005DFA055|nr:hypothetical protein [Klebsiella quasipneumoniae]MEA4435511.1 hypothetical protein [Klebsiella pneumoniae]CEL82153.1 regulatory protein [Klebsiella quasipneumoniae]
MSKVKVAPIELEIDATEVINQVEELLGLLEFPARSLEGIPEDVVNLLFDNIRPLLNDIVLSDFSTTVGTTDANKICIKVEIIGTLEHLASAIRASNFHRCQF